MTGARVSRTPVTTTFEWINEPSVIYYTTDGSQPQPGAASTKMWDSTGPREPGQSFVISDNTKFRWLSKDMKGNVATGMENFVITGKPKG